MIIESSNINVKYVFIIIILHWLWFLTVNKPIVFRDYTQVALFNCQQIVRKHLWSDKIVRKHLWKVYGRSTEDLLRICWRSAVRLICRHLCCSYVCRWIRLGLLLLPFCFWTCLGSAVFLQCCCSTVLASASSGPSWICSSYFECLTVVEGLTWARPLARGRRRLSAHFPTSAPAEQERVPGPKCHPLPACVPCRGTAGPVVGL